ncbi:hypothetical protein RND71_037640 [Anisodus tanguticus]|uniref:Pentatricopeptide repeat-containing protein n=1 Tax=Anisodus tanguticus TaxID=243964 RepID=A0AAE1QZ45_9SOLA|nr:hypothetical protein RND71_037640 [Anisodus tanguticus]
MLEKVEDIILEFKNLHAELELRPISSQYQMLIMYCCELFKVHAALDMVDQMFEAGLTLPLKSFNSILEACDKSWANETNFFSFSKEKRLMGSLGVNHQKNSYFLRSVLVSALASHGQMSDALKIYEEMKEAQCKSIVDLLKKLVDVYKYDEVAKEVLFDEVLRLFLFSTLYWKQ